VTIANIEFWRVLTTYALDFLAFSVTMFFTTRLSRKVRGLRAPTLLEIIAKDATWYFLVIFTAHFALEMTILFGRVSAIVLLSLLQLMTLTSHPYLSRNRSNSFRARE
jgi:hypothetical protein